MDELAILIASRAHNIHTIVLINLSYWSTRSDLDFGNCLVKLAYCGETLYKEITQTDAALNLKAKVKVKVDALEGDNAADSGLESEMDVEGVKSDDDVTIQQIEITPHCQDVEPSEGEGDMDITPENVNNPSSSKDTSALDITPGNVTNPSCSMDTSALDITPGYIDNCASVVTPEDATIGNIVIKPNSGDTVQSDDEMDANEQSASKDDVQEDNADAEVVITGITFGSTSKEGRIYRTAKYVCYIYDFESEMQSGFVDHFTTLHSGCQFKCDFCEHYFNTSNRLFKHQRSHLYLKYHCDLCGHRTQFPYQLNAHRKTHSKTDMFGCSQCDRQFASKSSQVGHDKTHTTSIKCDQCPADKNKIFTSENAFKLHERGMHGAGRTAKCGQHFKWKSKFTRHRHSGDCKVCTKDLADAKMERYSFLKKIKIE